MDKIKNGGIPEDKCLYYFSDYQPDLQIDDKKFSVNQNGIMKEYAYSTTVKKGIEESIYDICKKQFYREKKNVKNQR